MNGQDLRLFQVKTGSRYDLTFPGANGRREVPEDGYEFMAASRTSGWRTLASWGNPGWDLGDWPFVVIMVRGPKVGQEGEPPYEVVVHVEGDLTFYEFPTDAFRTAALTYLFIWYARHGGRDYASTWDPEDEATWPPDSRGPYGYLRTEVA